MVLEILDKNNIVRLKDNVVEIDLNNKTISYSIAKRVGVGVSIKPTSEKLDNIVSIKVDGRTIYEVGKTVFV